MRGVFRMGIQRLIFPQFSQDLMSCFISLAIILEMVAHCFQIFERNMMGIMDTLLLQNLDFFRQMLSRR